MAKMPEHFYFRIKAGITKVEIEDASDADVVEVVRCKDCKHYKPGKHFDDIPFCYRLKGKDGKPVGYNFSPDDFCSRGERRDDVRTV